MIFHKMDLEKGIYKINQRVSFKPIGKFDRDILKEVANFSWKMTFGKEGEHRKNRSGGSKERTLGEIFSNTFQGKLAEYAVYNYLKNKNVTTDKPDFTTYELGKWDSYDIKIDDKKIAIKSTKHYGNLLLLEVKDWNNQGLYIPNITEDEGKYDLFIVVRIRPSSEDQFKYIKNIDSKKEAEKHIGEIRKNLNLNWEFDIPGYITQEDLKTIINKEFIIKEYSKLQSHKTTMDADNYYVQFGDMRRIDSLINILSK